MLGVVMLIIALIFGLMGISAGSSLDSVLSEHGDKQSNGTYVCHDDPARVAIDIANAKKPQAEATDDKTGTHYLRYDRDVVSISGSGPNDCLIKIEPQDRVRGGGFIFLGPGFFPSSPSRSSGGTSGGGGVK